MNGLAKAALLAAVTVLAGGGLVWLNADNKPAQALVSASSRASASVLVFDSAHKSMGPASAVPTTDAELKRVPLLPVDQSLSATQSLANARENGDSRAPPIKHEPDATQAATAAELADPKAYQAYEARQNLRLYAAFNDAATAELPKLRSDVERGRAAGIDPDKIAKVEEKIRRIEVEQAKLLKDHPELKK